MADSPDCDRWTSERRQSSRHAATRLPSLRASILAGPDVRVINVSRRGLLVESEVRLTPGAGICLNLHSEDQIYTIGGRIVRVDAALVGGKMKYRAGVMLDKNFAIFDFSSEEPSDAPTIDTSAEQVPSPTAWPHIVPESESHWMADRHDLPPAHTHPQEPNEALEQLQVALAASETYQKRSAETHAAERARWDEERRALERRLRQAEQQTAELSRQLTARVDAERRLARQHDEERAQKETALRNMQQQLAEIEAHQAALIATSTQHLKVYEEERENWAAQNSRLTAQLETTEAWCVDQQDLLYQIRHEMSRVFALLTRVRSRPVRKASESAAIEMETD